MSKRLNNLITFARGVLVHGDIVRAAIDAGAKGPESVVRARAEAWLKHPDVADILTAQNRRDVLKQAVSELAVADVKDELFTREGMQRWLAAAMRGEIADEVVDKLGAVHEIQPPLSSKLAAAKQLATMLGFMVQRVEVTEKSDTVVFLIPTNGRGPTDAADATVVVDALPADLSEIAGG